MNITLAIDEQLVKSERKWNCRGPSVRRRHPVTATLAGGGS
jgi:hypothetical protein